MPVSLRRGKERCGEYDTEDQFENLSSRSNFQGWNLVPRCFFFEQEHTVKFVSGKKAPLQPDLRGFVLTGVLPHATQRSIHKQELEQTQVPEA